MEDKNLDGLLSYLVSTARYLLKEPTTVNMINNGSYETDNDNKNDGCKEGMKNGGYQKSC